MFGWIMFGWIMSGWIMFGWIMFRWMRARWSKIGWSHECWLFKLIEEGIQNNKDEYWWFFEIGQRKIEDEFRLFGWVLNE